jgi:hypothetical protein
LKIVSNPSTGNLKTPLVLLPAPEQVELPWLRLLLVDVRLLHV